MPSHSGTDSILDSSVPTQIQPAELPGTNYQIEHRVSSVLAVGAHNFWALRNLDTGEVEAELHGFAVSDGGAINTTGNDGDTLKSILVREGEWYSPGESQLSKIIPGDKATLRNKFNAAIKTGEHLNDENIGYRAIGQNIEGSSGNSNTSAYTFGRAMGQTEAELEAGINNNGYWDPGFDRDFHEEILRNSGDTIRISNPNSGISS